VRVAELEFPVRVKGVHGRTRAVLVPAELAGILRLARERVVTYGAEAGDFLVTRRGYAGFRLYARTIDEVDGLRRYFEDQGIESATEAERIRDVLELDRYLSYVFWMIAGVGLLGSMAALVASLYASVERKRRSLSVLRLIGLRRWELVRFPVYQGLTLVSFALIASYGFFRLVAETINSYFGRFLEAEENLCRLPLFEAVAAVVLCLGLAGAASLAAAMRIAFIEPGEGLRDE